MQRGHGSGGWASGRAWGLGQRGSCAPWKAALGWELVRRKGLEQLSQLRSGPSQLPQQMVDGAQQLAVQQIPLPPGPLQAWQRKLWEQRLGRSRAPPQALVLQGQQTQLVEGPWSQLVRGHTQQA